MSFLPSKDRQISLLRPEALWRVPLLVTIDGQQQPMVELYLKGVSFASVSFVPLASVGAGVEVVVVANHEKKWLSLWHSSYWSEMLTKRRNSLACARTAV